MKPSSAVKAAPERPQTTIAVINGPSSRQTEMPIRSATKMLAPYRLSCAAAWNAIARPTRKLIETMIGTASAPERSIVAGSSRQLAERGERKSPAPETTICPKNASTSCSSCKMEMVARPSWSSVPSGRRGRSRATTLSPP
jgi:hypothetical protein